METWQPKNKDDLCSPVLPNGGDSRRPPPPSAAAPSACPRRRAAPGVIRGLNTAFASVCVGWTFRASYGRAGEGSSGPGEVPRGLATQGASFLKLSELTAAGVSPRPREWRCRCHYSPAAAAPAPAVVR